MLPQEDEGGNLAAYLLALQLFAADASDSDSESDPSEPEQLTDSPAFNSAQQQWEQTTAQGGKQLSESLSAALQQGMSAHAIALAKAEQAAAQQARQHWSEMHQTVQKSTDALTQQQAEMARHAGLLQKALESTDQVRELEGALNRNLDALANEHNFEETVLSLSAAIQLLTAQLHGGVVSRRKEATSKQTKANAA